MSNPPLCGTGCHLETRCFWPGCDDTGSNAEAHTVKSRTVGPISPKLAQLVPQVNDHTVGNHAIMSKLEKSKKMCDCGCKSRELFRVSRDTPGCRPLHRAALDRTRLLGNKAVHHTNEMCSMRNSASCPSFRVRGWGPHTFSYRCSNSSVLAERDYDMEFCKHEIVKELDALETTARKLETLTYEAENAFKETEKPLLVSRECLQKHHGRQDFAECTDEVEEVLQQEKNNLYQWREKLDNIIETAHAQIRHNCELGSAMTDDYHNRHHAKRVDCHTHKFQLNPQLKAVIPEMWSSAVKSRLLASRIEREKTLKLCKNMHNLMDRASNEIWQHANISKNAVSSHIQQMHRERENFVSKLLEIEREIREMDRVVLMVRRSIRDKELSVKKASMQIDERTRHLNMDVCSDAMLANMKKEQKDTCDNIKLMKDKLADHEKTVTALQNQRAELKKHLSLKEHDLNIDAVDCQPLQRELNVSTRRGPVIKIPFRQN